MAEVRLEQVEKRFGDITAVAGIDLTIHDGESRTGTGTINLTVSAATKYFEDTHAPCAGTKMPRPRGYVRPGKRVRR